jgi:hypothetical protein
MRRLVTQTVTVQRSFFVEGNNEEELRDEEDKVLEMFAGELESIRVLVLDSKTTRYDHDSSV